MIALLPCYYPISSELFWGNMRICFLILSFLITKMLQVVENLCLTEDSQAGKLKFFGTRPNWVVSYIAYTKFHSPRPVFHSPGQIFTRIGERASASFPAWFRSGYPMISILYHCCCCLLTPWSRCQGIGSHGIYLVIPKYSTCSTRRDDPVHC